MFWSGKVLPGFSAASLASFHLAILPRKISDSTGTGRIGCTKGHGLGTNLADAAGRADGLIVQPRARFLLVGFSPLGVHGEREGCARAGDVCRKSTAYSHGGQCYSDGFEKCSFHYSVPFG